MSKKKAAIKLYRKIKNENISKKRKISLLLPLFTFFTFFTFYDGAVWCVDTPTYIKMTVDREPIYPLFLFFFRSLLQGRDEYLFIAVLLQGLLTAYSIYSFTIFLEEKLNFKQPVSFAIEAVFLLVSLLNRFVAKRGSMYSNSLLSESIAFPLFILFFRYLMEFIYERSNRSLAFSATLSFLLISTRKQMIISLLLLILAMIFACVIEKKPVFLVKSVLLVLLVISSNRFLDYSYNVFFHGINHTHTSSNRFLATMVFYCSEKDEADLIEDENTKELFLQIINECDRRELTKTKVVSSGWYNRTMHFCNNYDTIQLRIMWPMIREYVYSTTGVSENEAEILVDQYTSSISLSLLPKIWPIVLSTFFDNFILGMMTTVAAVKSIFIYYSCAVFFLYFILLLYSIWKYKLNNYSLLGVTVLLSIILNIGLVSFVIFPQTRYTFYNMPLFYISFFLLCFQQLKCIINKEG